MGRHDPLKPDYFLDRLIGKGGVKASFDKLRCHCLYTLRREEN